MRATMEASSSTSAAARRSAGAGPDPGGSAKKPRLPQQQQQPAPSRDPRSYAGGGTTNGGSGGTEQQAQVDELVSQYMTALGELTFNSKPIITNLTIIAGENLHAARPIAGLICANILEVPSDQKLPSLYLLDSIVKNIGKDYVKHFSARLPEVFCKAYRQVDPSVHSSMRHLFGTWKGVFSPASLQIIEKELGFQSSANRSSGAAPSKPDSQSQRPSHSIHVNPKYLEARQQLQQPNKGLLGTGAKEAMISDGGDDIDRANRIAIDKNAGRRLDVLNTRPRAQRDPFSNPTHEKPDRDVRALGFSNISQQPAVGAGQVRSKSKGQDGIGGPYYHAAVGSSEEQFDRRNNFYANKDARPPGPVRLDIPLLPTPVSNSDRIGRPASDKSWKNSEEEEYMWDDVRSQGADYRGTSSARKGELMSDDGNVASFQRAKWTELGDQMDPDLRKLDGFQRFGHATGQDRRIADYMDHEDYLHGKREVEPRIDREMWPEGQQFSDSRLLLSQEKTHPDVGRDPRISRFSNQSEDRPTIYSGSLSASITSSVPVGSLPVGLSGAYAGRSSLEGTTGVPTTFGQQKQKHWSSSPPPLQSPSSTTLFARQNSPSSAEHDVYTSRSFLPLGQNSQEEYNQRAAHSQGRHNLQEILSQASQQTQRRPSLQSKPHLKPVDQARASFSHENSSSLFRPSIQQPLSAAMGHQQSEEVSLASDSAHVTSDQISASNLLTGLIKSGFNPNPSDIASSRAQPPLPSAPHPHGLTSLPAASPSLQLSASENAILKPQAANSARPPLPPGPSPTETAEKAAPLSSLLSSLVAKGLISSPSTDLSATVPQKRSKPSLSKPDVTASTPPLSIVQPSISKETSAPTKTLLPQPVETKMVDLIGLEFKPALLRKYHEHVINGLFDDQSHQCETCGLRFRLEEELSVHSVCHGSTQPETRSSGIAPERWYPSKNYWIDEPREVQDIYLDSGASDTDLGAAEEICEFMVPADESQVICVLCGEPFDDIYSIDRVDWMYKDAVYFDYSKVGSSSGDTIESKEPGPIVHARCIPKSSNDGKEVD